MGPEVTDLEWLRATFPGADLQRDNTYGGWLMTWVNGAWAPASDAQIADRDERSIRSKFRLENDNGAKGSTWSNEDGWRTPVPGVFIDKAVTALESFLRAASAPRKAAELPALDFVAPRDAVVERTTPATLPLEYWEPVAIDAGGRVRMTRRRFLSGFYEWSLSILGPNGIVSWRVAPSDAPRIHAELCALRDEVSGLITRDEALRRPPVEPPPPAPVEPPKCAECGAACPGASMCVYCLHRLDNATRSPLSRASELGPSAVLDAVGEARERLDTEPSFHEGCAAWASACWDGEDWGKP